MINGLIIHRFKWRYFDHYLVPLLQKINPDYLITFLDNDPKVYKFKNYLPHSKIIVIQNGMRGYKKDFFSQTKTKNLKVDYLFTYNKHISDIYKNLLLANFMRLILQE